MVDFRRASAELALCSELRRYLLTMLRLTGHDTDKINFRLDDGFKKYQILAVRSLVAQGWTEDKLKLELKMAFMHFPLQLRREGITWFFENFNSLISIPRTIEEEKCCF